MNTKELWHLGPEEISRFDYTRIGSTEHCPHGWGFYLAEKESHARRMGYRHNLRSVKKYLHKVKLRLSEGEIYDLDRMFNQQDNRTKVKIIKYIGKLRNKIFCYKVIQFVDIFNFINIDEKLERLRRLHYQFKKNVAVADGWLATAEIELIFPEDEFRKLFLDIGIRAISLHEQDSAQDGLTYVCFDSNALNVIECTSYL